MHRGISREWNSASSTCRSHNATDFEIEKPSLRRSEKATSSGSLSENKATGVTAISLRTDKKNGTNRHSRGSFTTKSGFSSYSLSRISCIRPWKRTASSDAYHRGSSCLQSSQDESADAKSSV